MSEKIIYLYPRDCSFAKQKETYMRFHLAYRNAVGPQKRTLSAALVYFVRHWNISIRAQSDWTMLADCSEGKL